MLILGGTATDQNKHERQIGVDCSRKTDVPLILVTSKVQIVSLTAGSIVVRAEDVVNGIGRSWLGDAPSAAVRHLLLASQLNRPGHRFLRGALESMSPVSTVGGRLKRSRHFVTTTSIFAESDETPASASSGCGDGGDREHLVVTRVSGCGR